jgi:hypothetical protein
MPVSFDKMLKTMRLQIFQMILTSSAARLSPSPFAFKLREQTFLDIARAAADRL